MDRPMRRSRQLLPDETTHAILRAGSNGVLSLADSDGEPYGVPISYVFDGDSTIYFHSARSGHKIDCIDSDCSCPFCVVAQDDVRPEEFTTYFRSAICFGRISVVGDTDEAVRALHMLSEKYSPGVDDGPEIARFLKAVAVLRLDIRRMTGKESIELVRMRQP